MPASQWLNDYWQTRVASYPSPFTLASCGYWLCRTRLPCICIWEPVHTHLEWLFHKVGWSSATTQQGATRSSYGTSNGMTVFMWLFTLHLKFSCYMYPVCSMHSRDMDLVASTYTYSNKNDQMPCRTEIFAGPKFLWHSTLRRSCFCSLACFFYCFSY